MSKIKNKIGQKIGNFLVLSFNRRENKKTYWNVLCDCGRESVIYFQKRPSKFCKYCYTQYGQKSNNYKGFEDISLTFFTSLKNQARERNKEFNLTIDYLWDLFIKQNRRCAYTQKLLYFNEFKKYKRGNASLDRIDSSIGYVEGNVQWVEKRVNTAKHILKDMEFNDLCSSVHFFHRYKEIQQKPISHRFSEKIFGLIEFEPELYKDSRGINWESYNTITHFPHLVQIPGFDFSTEFIYDSVSSSKQNVLRGMHGDNLNFKLVSCIDGEIQLFVIDVRKNSPTRGNWEEFIINNSNKKQLLVPKGCVNGHLCVSNTCLFYYKLTHSYVKPEEQIVIKWNDPQFNLPWRTKFPILSKRDEIGPFFEFKR